MMTETDRYEVFVEDVRAMIGFTEADFELFRRHRAFFTEHASALVGFIGEVLSSHPPTRVVFEDGRGDAEKLAASVASWLGEVLEGHDTPELWRRHYLIGLEHIRRKIPNRHMMGLAVRIRELLLPMMLGDLGADEGVPLFLAFQRFLDMVVALTTTLVEEGQKRCILEATGFTEILLDKLQATVFETIAAELGG